MARTDVSWLWQRALNDAARAQIRTLFDQTLESETTIGFAAPMTDRQAEDYLDGLQADLERGRKEIMLGRTQEGEVIAMVLLARDPQPNCGHRAELSKCIIRPSHRGNGVLLSGLHALVDHCRQENIHTVTLDVRQGSRAEAVWRKLGFVQFGELRDYAHIDGRVEAGVYMSGDIVELARRAQPRS